MRKDLTGSKFMLYLVIWNIIVREILFGVLAVLQNADVLDTNALRTSPWFLIGTQLLIFILPLGIWLAFKKEPLRMPNWKLGGKNILIIVALSFLMQPAMMMISMISAQFFHNYIPDVLYNFMQYPAWLMLVAIAVTPAICEEVVFRGYLQAQHRDYSIRNAALLNGLFFAIIHFNLQQFAYAFAMGIIFAYMVHYTRSIWAAILPHFIINATQATWGRLALATEVAEDVPEPTTREVFIVFGVIVLVLMPLVVLLFRAFVNHNRWRLTAKEQYGNDAVAVTHDNEYVHDENSGQNRDSIMVAPAETTEPQPDIPTTPPSRFDPYAIAVVAIFIIIQYLMMRAV